jgi:hypothetical protein
MIEPTLLACQRGVLSRGGGDEGNACDCGYMRVRSYSTVDAIEQKDMVNSGVGGAKEERKPTSRLRLVASDT